MEVILKVAKNSITPTTQRDCYQLDLEWTHGDADGESQETHFFKKDEEEKLKLFLAIQESLNDNDYLCDQATEFLKANTKLSDDDIADIAQEFDDTFYKGDHTADYSFGAALSGCAVTWWDSEGKQFEVTFKVKK